MPAHKWANIQTESKSHSAKDDVMFIGAAVLVTYIICTIFKVLFFPFRLLFTSHDYEKDIEKAKEKVLQRKHYITRIGNDDNDLMNRYEHSLTTHDEEAIEWHKRWLNGKVLDPELRWAPEVYIDKQLNSEFLKYFEYQMYKIQKSSGSAQWLFSRTVKRYYPEFSSNFKHMAQDLETLKERVKVRELSNELKNEIRKLGVPEELAESMAKSDLEPEEIKRRAQYIKICTERNFSKKACEWLAKHGEEYGFEADSPYAEMVNDFIGNNMLPEAGIAAATGKISKEELAQIGDDCRSFVNLVGPGTAYGESPSGSGKTNYDEYQMGILQRLIARKEDTKAVWR